MLNFCCRFVGNIILFVWNIQQILVPGINMMQRGMEWQYFTFTCCQLPLTHELQNFSSCCQIFVMVSDQLNEPRESIANKQKHTESNQKAQAWFKLHCTTNSLLELLVSPLAPLCPLLSMNMKRASWEVIGIRKQGDRLQMYFQLFEWSELSKKYTPTGIRGIGSKFKVGGGSLSVAITYITPQDTPLS